MPRPGDILSQRRPRSPHAGQFPYWRCERCAFSRFYASVNITCTYPGYYCRWLTKQFNILTLVDLLAQWYVFSHHSILDKCRRPASKVDSVYPHMAIHDKVSRRLLSCAPRFIVASDQSTRTYRDAQSQILRFSLFPHTRGNALIA